MSLKELYETHRTSQAAAKRDVGTSRASRVVSHLLSSSSSSSSSSFVLTGAVTDCLIVASLTHTENLRREALMSTSALTEALTDSVNAGVVDVFENQKKVEDAARELSDAAGVLKVEASAWARDLESFDKELRAIGDFENWVKAMEHDLATLAGALEEKVGAGKKK
jgi:hypothetical protein